MYRLGALVERVGAAWVTTNAYSVSVLSTSLLYMYVVMCMYCIAKKQMRHCGLAAARRHTDTDECDGGTIASFTVPLQKAYLANAVALTKPPHGGFFHSCYLGAYFNSNFGSTSSVVPRPTSGIWNQIALKVGGPTMQKAIQQWWTAPKTSAAAAFENDGGWNATGEYSTLVR